MTMHFGVDVKLAARAGRGKLAQVVEMAWALYLKGNAVMLIGGGGIIFLNNNDPRGIWYADD